LGGSSVAIAMQAMQRAMPLLQCNKIAGTTLAREIA
jgi:hypothetical protein